VGSPCSVCGEQALPFATATVLRTHTAQYAHCRACGLVQAIEVDWLEEAYANPIASEDLGLVARCQQLSRLVTGFVRLEGLSGPCLDFAGGYGLLTRMLRDRGLEFRHHDPYTQNVFAEGFEDAQPSGRYALITAVEVLEHLEHPIAWLRTMAEHTDLLLLSTHVLPEGPPRPDEWWYYTPETGQHITFFAERTFTRAAQQLGWRYTKVTGSVHPRGPVTAEAAGRRRDRLAGPGPPGQSPGPGRPPPRRRLRHCARAAL
jgi:hypothetical protein